MKRSSSDNMPAFGKKLMLLRQSQNLRQEDLAKVLQVSRATVSYYESRAKNPTTEFVQKVADFFSVTTDQLLRDEAHEASRPGPTSKLERQLQLIRTLPPQKQKLISDMLEMILRGEFPRAESSPQAEP